MPDSANSEASSRRSRSISLRVSVNVSVAASRIRQDLADADGRGGLLELALQPLLQAQQRLKVLVGEVAANEHFGMIGADPVDAAVALYEPHRVPRQVVVDDVPGLLEVHAFG